MFRRGRSRALGSDESGGSSHNVNSFGMSDFLSTERISLGGFSRDVVFACFLLFVYRVKVLFVVHQNRC